MGCYVMKIEDALNLEEGERADVEAIVLRISSPYETKAGKIVEVVLGGERRNAILVGSGDVVKDLKKLSVGDEVVLVDVLVGEFRGTPRLIFDEESELHVKGSVDSAEVEKRLGRSVEDLEHGDYARIEGVLRRDPYDTGGKVVVDVYDGTGTARVRAWGDAADVLAGMEFGDPVRVEGVVTVRGDRVSLSVLRSLGDVEPLGGPEELDLSRWRWPSVDDLSVGDVEEILGTVVAVPARRHYYEACPRCGRSVRDGACPEHGPVESPEKRPFLPLVIDDGTGTVRVALFGYRAVEAVGCDDEQEYLNLDVSDLEENLVGRPVVAEVEVRDVGDVEDLEAVGRRARVLSDCDAVKEAHLRGLLLLEREEDR